MPVRSKYTIRKQIVGGAISIAATPQAVAKREKKAETATEDQKKAAQQKLFLAWPKF